MSAKRTVRRTRSDRTKDGTDWERLRNMTEEEMERGAQGDPDNPPWTEEELAAAELVMPSDEPKIPLSIRLDAEILEFFRKEGSGYQSRINAVLLGYVRSRRRSK